MRRAAALAENQREGTERQSFVRRKLWVSRIIEPLSPVRDTFAAANLSNASTARKIVPRRDSGAISLAVSPVFSAKPPLPLLRGPAIIARE